MTYSGLRVALTLLITAVGQQHDSLSLIQLQASSKVNDVNSYRGDEKVCVSLAAYEQADWIDALIENALKFTHESTHIMIHLNALGNYTDDRISKWNNIDRIQINPERVPVKIFHGSILYAHLLNFKHMPESCDYVIMQASNMMWVRTGMEHAVRAEIRFAGVLWKEGALPGQAAMEVPPAAKGNQRNTPPSKGNARQPASPSGPASASVAPKRPLADNTPPPRPAKAAKAATSAAPAQQVPSSPSAGDERAMRLEAENAKLRADLERMRVLAENAELRAQLEALRNAKLAKEKAGQAGEAAPAVRTEPVQAATEPSASPVAPSIASERAPTVPAKRAKASVTAKAGVQSKEAVEQPEADAAAKAAAKVPTEASQKTSESSTPKVASAKRGPAKKEAPAKQASAKAPAKAAPAGDAPASGGPSALDSAAVPQQELEAETAEPPLSVPTKPRKGKGSGKGKEKARGKGESGSNSTAADAEGSQAADVSAVLARALIVKRESLAFLQKQRNALKAFAKHTGAVIFPDKFGFGQPVPAPTPRDVVRRKRSEPTPTDAVANAPCGNGNSEAETAAAGNAILPAFGKPLQNKPAAEDTVTVGALIRRLAEDEGAQDAGDAGGTGKGGGRRGGKGRGKGGRGAVEDEAGAASKEQSAQNVDEDFESEEEVLEDIPETAEDGSDEVASTTDAWPTSGGKWPDVWSSFALQPGEEGFCSAVRQCISNAGVGTTKSPLAGLGLFPHQEATAFMVHPASPIRRLLIDHAVGTGKKLIMLRMLDNFFDDVRPKLVLFPKDSMCDQFYMELLKWPTRWRHYFSYCCPEHAALASGDLRGWFNHRFEVWDLSNDKIQKEAKRRNVLPGKIVRELIDAARKALAMEDFLTSDGSVGAAAAHKYFTENPTSLFPRAPLCALLYSTAGGGAAEQRAKDGRPRSVVLRCGSTAANTNPYSNKVIMLGAAHHLVRPTQKYKPQLARLQDLLRAAHGSVLVAFTGALSYGHPGECRRLLDIVKGEDGALVDDEGFVSSVQTPEDAPPELQVRGAPKVTGYPRWATMGDMILQTGGLQEVTKLHSMHAEALKRYVTKESQMQISPEFESMPAGVALAKLALYCNLHVPNLNYSTSAQKDVLSDVKGFLPKMHAVSKSVANSELKTVVIMLREDGYRAMHDILQKSGKTHGFKVATLDDAEAFNESARNIAGKRYRVLLAEASRLDEHTFFLHVRRIILLGIPLGHSTLHRWIGSCVRLGSHVELPEEERQLVLEVHLVQLPKFLRQGPSSLVYRELIFQATSTPGVNLEMAAEECTKVLKKRKGGVKTLVDMQRELQSEDGEQLIDLLVETALECLACTSMTPAKALSKALKRLRRGGDDMEQAERVLTDASAVKTADELLHGLFIRRCGEVQRELQAIRQHDFKFPASAPGDSSGKLVDAASSASNGHTGDGAGCATADGGVADEATERQRREEANPPCEPDVDE